MVSRETQSLPPESAKEREPLQALEQKRASSAWTQVQKEVREDKGKEYYTAVRKAPAMVKTNGLGQTLAFLLAKEERDAKCLLREQPKKAEGLLYRHLEEWLLKEAPIAWTSRDETLIERVIQEKSAVYRQATQEALAYLGWLKRFAEARFGGQKQSGE